jgi:hypothetical protein
MVYQPTAEDRLIDRRVSAVAASIRKGVLNGSNWPELESPVLHG